MARPVDAEALEKKISEWLGQPGNGDYYSGYDAALCAVQDLIADTPTLTPPNEWVSVEERLPERGKDVLLYFEEESRISVGGRYDVGDGWYAVIVNEYETICDTSPRYWMLLPVPPDSRPPEGEEAT